MKSKKTMVFLLLAVLIVFCGCPDGNSKVKSKANRPLYEDESGWLIWSEMSCEIIVNHYYYAALGRMESMGLSAPSNFAPGFKYLSKNDPEQFYGLVMIVPDGMQVFWSRYSVVTMTYVSKNDTLTIDSTEYLVIRKCDLSALHGEEHGMIAIPSTGDCELFHTPKDHPVVFAKFPFARKPDFIVGCEVSRVTIKEGGRL